MPSQVEGGPSSAQRRNYEAERRANAQIIINVGRQMGASQRDILIALMTAMQESGLRNLNYGDRDSLGLFQQRPSQGWGTRQQVMDPQYASRKFFEGLFKVKNRNSMALTQAAQAVQRSAFPNAYAKHESYARSLLQSLGGLRDVGPALQSERRPGTTQQALPQGNRPTRGRIAGPGSAPGDITGTNEGWRRRSRGPAGVSASPAQPMEIGGPAVTDAVAEVFPEWEAPPGVADIASAATSQVTKTADQPIDISQWTLDEMSQEQYEQAIQAVGGVITAGPAAGATGKAGDIINYAKQFLGVPYKWGGASPLGFDCSGLLYYVYKQFGVNLPRVSFQQARFGRTVSREEAQPGDLWAMDNSPRNNGADHIAIFLGGPRNEVLEAPRAGVPVRVRSLSQKELNEGWFQRVL